MLGGYISEYYEYGRYDGMNRQQLAALALAEVLRKVAVDAAAQATSHKAQVPTRIRIEVIEGKYDLCACLILEGIGP